MFATVLVANRGEIALRVIRAARAAGLRTVAVYSDADAHAPHVRAADAAARLGPAPAAESYLSVPALLAAARATGADAVHPGYGFLAEDAGFARACTEAGLVWIGPPAEVVARMGRKDLAREVARAAGVPVLPAVGDGGDAEDADLARRAAAEVGLPLLVKATAGGGGKGMRVVTAAADLPAALAAARREAAAAFGDDRVLIERYVPRGRHVEVQVLADAHGHVLHLGERDCSVQRRYQKVVEEAPAPTISPALRARLTDAAVRLARAVGYVGLGTVEFLVAGEEAYFLEMNTRLQVEHPVTEAVTGLDLVALQLAVAQGAPLPLTQDDVTTTGHAIEVRVYAEDRQHLPQAGTARTVRWPEGVRVEAALEDGQEVGPWYDPLLGKLIAHGPTREAARRRLLAALDATAVVGLTTNTGFLRRLLASAAFADAEIDTGWLGRHPDPFPPGGGDVARCVAAWVLAGPGPGDRPGHPFGVGDGWRLGGPAAPRVVALVDGDGGRYELVVDRAGGLVMETDGGATGDGERPDGKRSGGEPADGAHAAGASGPGASTNGERADGGSGHGERAGRRRRVRPLSAPAGWLHLEIDGVTHLCTAEVDAAGVTVVHEGEARTWTRPDPLAAAAAAPPDGPVRAPMPGVVRGVSVRAGESVRPGQVLGVLEAMKMEMPLTAPRAGTVTVDVAVGDQVEVGQALFTVEAA
ncbi:biotin carboxylase N-terminal domain-containing protein [Georgenia sp. TF02-10]|uniref:acetyl/propionyl/methylcrotonyl-CoA carboxylase subunit alpha n=1 Tax=Georgenia sp. TF02-10 TaxID=2917725 RepID=UPI00352C73C7